jgi:Tfp pilus assembly protein PilV
MLRSHETTTVAKPAYPAHSACCRQRRTERAGYIAARPAKSGRTGFSLLEFQVALVLLGIGLVGLFPLVVMQSRAVASLERRLAPQTTYYLVPWPSPWARKLGAKAQVTATPSAGSAAAVPLTPVNDVSVLSLSRLVNAEEVQAVVQVNASLPP